MRVFIIQNTPLDAPLPLSIYLTGLLSRIRSRGGISLNLISGPGLVPESIAGLCDSIYQIDASTFSIKDNLCFALRALSILRKEGSRSDGVDIVHCLYPNSSLVAGVLYKRLFGKSARIIYDVRSPWIEMSIERGHVSPFAAPVYRRLLHSVERYLCARVDTFMFITRGLAGYYREEYSLPSASKVYISPTGVDLELFKRVPGRAARESHGIAADDILVGSVGGITSERSPEQIVRLFAKVIRDDPRVKLMLVGGGRDSHVLERLKGLAKELGVSDSIIFTGTVAHRDVPAYISSFDYGLIHLPDEFIFRHSFPLKILEYLACGVPVLASRVKCNEEISKELSGLFIYETAEDISRVLARGAVPGVPENIMDYDWRTLGANYMKMYGDLAGTGEAKDG